MHAHTNYASYTQRWNQPAYRIHEVPVSWPPVHSAKDRKAIFLQCMYVRKCVHIYEHTQTHAHTHTHTHTLLIHTHSFLCTHGDIIYITHSAILITTEAVKQLSTDFSTSLLLENRWKIWNWPLIIMRMAVSVYCGCSWYTLTHTHTHTRCLPPVYTWERTINIINNAYLSTVDFLGVLYQ
jgi:hypothetical protein